jgi:hypothetical protein
MFPTYIKRNLGTRSQLLYIMTFVILTIGMKILVSTVVQE